MKVYLLTCLINGKYYVGMTTKAISHRLSEHKCAARCGSKFPIHLAINKYGAENFVIEELNSAEKKENLEISEKLWILALNSRDRNFGYNLCAGGEGRSVSSHKSSHVSSDKFKKFISNLHRGKVLSEVTKSRISDAQKARWSKIKDRKISESTRKKLSESHKGKIMSEETKRRMRIAAKLRAVIYKARASAKRAKKATLVEDTTHE